VASKRCLFTYIIFFSLQLGWGGVELKLLIILVLSKGRADMELKIDIR
jgi:hypothetical protein